MRSFVDHCIISVPITARLKQVGGGTETAETAKLIKEGDPVSVDLGYNGKMKNEFIGFVTRVDLSTPLHIMCEGYVYQLRSSLKPKVLTNTTLKGILQYIIEGTDITLSPDIPDMPFVKWQFTGKSGAEELESLKKIDHHIYLDIFFTGKQLYAGLKYLNYKGDVKYRLRWNVINDDQLKLREAKNQDVIVNILGEEKNGNKKSKVKASETSGAAGETVRIKTYAITDDDALEAIADRVHERLSYDGYEGKITCFLFPYCEPAYRGILTDLKYPERSGNYIIESTEVRYWIRGARRIAEIGLKL